MNSIWELETFYQKRDIVIVGAGFTGLWTAISLKEKNPKLNVLVIEKNPIPLGASTRNAGFACFGSLTEIIADSQKMGWEKTLDLIEKRYKGLQKIQKYFSNSEIDYQNCGGFEILNDENALHQIEKVNQQLKSITKIDTFKLNQTQLQELKFGKSKFLVENPLEGALHSGKLLQNLLKKCHQLNVDFIFGNGVESITENHSEIEIELENTSKITSNKIVFCTNAFSSKFLPNEEIIPARGQVVLTEPIENLPFRGTFHYDEGFYYFRNLGNRVLLGGARNQDFQNEETTEIDISEKLQNHLENFLKEVVIPDINFKISHRWSGIMAMGSEKTPVVKQISERQFCAVRLSGMGVALAPIISEEIATKMI